jgi:hypothetical protein
MTAIHMNSIEGTKFPPVGGNPFTCSIEGCAKPHKAKGLCVMHYRRLQRNGDPNRTRTAGRRADGVLKIVHQLFQDWSPRTQTRYAQAWRLANAAGIDIRDVIKKVTRPNGTLSVVGFANQVETLAWPWLMRQLRDLAAEPADEARP